MAAPTKKPAPRVAAPEAAEAPAAPAPNSDNDVLKAQLAALQAQLAAAQAEAALAKVGVQRGDATGATQYVGIRNTSNYSIDLPKSPIATEPGVQLVPDTDTPDPRQVAVISYAWWMQLRNHNLVANGMIMRDDAVLGAQHTPAPADEAKDLPPNAHANTVRDVGKFFTEQSEYEILERIERMTSEQTIRRLQFAIDMDIKRIQDALPMDNQNPTKRAQDALKALPGKLVKAEQALADRYLQLTAKYREG